MAFISSNISFKHKQKAFFCLIVVLTSLLNTKQLKAHNIDSLKKVFIRANNTIDKINAGTEIIRACQGNHDSVIFYTEKVLKVWNDQKDEFALAQTYCVLARVFCEEGRFEKAKEYGQRSIDIGIKINNDSIIAKAYINIGFTHYTEGDFEKATENYFASLKYSEKSKHEKLSAAAFNYLGLTFSTKPNHDYKKALDYLFKALEIDRKTNNTKDLGYVLLRIGGIYSWQNDFDKALKYFSQSARLADSAHIMDLQKWNLEFAADIYSKKKDYKTALPLYFKSLRLSLLMNEIPGIVGSYINISDVHKKMGDYAQAHMYIDSAYFVCLKYKTNSVFSRIYWCKSDIYEKQGDLKNAFAYFKKGMGARDSVFSEKNSNNINELEKKYETEKKEKELSEKSGELKLQKAESEKQQAQRNAFIVGFGIVFVLLAFIFRGYRQKQKANEIIHSQKRLVEGKNKDITDSINYAKKIQEAILPAKELKYRIFPDAFVLFQPRDIVSGDFYWFSEQNGKRLIAAVDCTGHGVPGAFMSMIGNAFLNEIVNEKGVTKPSEILDQLNDLVITSLKQNESENKDGMDISILSFDMKSQTVEFAGANNPCWHIRGQKITETKGNKRPIGLYGKNDVQFTNHQIEFQRSDSFYIFTDGYADQFGGQNGKKFMYRQLQETLLSNQNEAMLKQEELLLKKFREWKGNLEQVDDVLIIGVRV